MNSNHGEHLSKDYETDIGSRTSGLKFDQQKDMELLVLYLCSILLPAYYI
jgi:hypothetical protein